jgi:hypothetical protein
VPAHGNFIHAIAVTVCLFTISCCPSYSSRHPLSISSGSPVNYQTLLAWAMRKFKRFAAHKIRASR